MNRKRLKYYLLILFFLVSIENYSYGKKNPPYPKPNNDPYPELPIDGGISVLIILGTLYGVHKIENSKKE